MKYTKEARNYIDNHDVWSEGLPIFRRDLSELMSEFVEHIINKNTNSFDSKKVSFKEKINQKMNCLRGSHEWECSDLHKGKVAEVSSWCKHCGTSWKPK